MVLIPTLNDCSCGSSREQTILVCGKCTKPYPFTQRQISKLYKNYLNEKVSRIEQGNMFAVEQLIHFYENIDPQVSEIIRAIRDTVEIKEKKNG